MEPKERENIGWIDLLRVVACFAVVFAHCCDGFVAQFDADRTSFLTGVFAGSLMRPSVPLFVMMTGALLLPLRPGATLAGFYRKRIGRILPPLVFWSVALPSAAFCYFRFVDPATANPLVDAAGYTGGSLLGRLSTFVFNFNFDTTPLWYLYMLAGLYLLIPVLSGWLAQASRRDLRIVLGIWGFTLLLPYLGMAAPLLGYRGNYGNMGLYGVCDWNAYGTFHYFSGFAGYLLLAYYLMKYPPEWSWRKTAAVGVPMFVAGYLVTSLGYILTQRRFPGDYAYLEIVWYFTGINVFLMTFPVFVAFRKLRLRSRPWLSRLARCTFGIYLCHYIFVFAAYDLFDIASWPCPVRIVCMACFAFAAGWAVTRTLACFRTTRRFIE